MTLRSRARVVYGSPLVAQRIKRLRSIESKLRRWEKMQLARMHDIGGCRAVMRTVDQVHRVVEIYDQSRMKSPNRGAQFVRKYDYIAHPKPDGYRGIHLVYRYRSSSRGKKIYNGLRIEIQLRTQLQHAWATAVEAVSMFTGQALKSNVGEFDAPAGHRRKTNRMAKNGCPGQVFSKIRWQVDPDGRYVK